MALDPDELMLGKYAALYYGSGTPQALTNEPMEEISDIENGNPRYTVYQITNEDKQALSLGTVPVFERQIGGTGDFADIPSSEILEVQYPGARVVFDAAQGVSDVIRVKSGHYLVKTQLYGALTVKISDKTIMKDVTPLGAKAKRNFPTIDEVSVSLDAFLSKICSSLLTTDLKLTHYDGGAAGNDLSFEMVDPGTTHALEITVTGDKISVTLGYATGAINSTNQQVIDAVNADPFVRRKKVLCEIIDEADRDELAVAFAEDDFAGGVDAENFSDKKSSPLMLEIFGDEDNDVKWQTYGYLSEIGNTNASPEDVVKQSLTFSSYGKVYYRPR